MAELKVGTLSHFLDSARALAVQAAVQRVVGVLTSIFLARVLGSTQFGVYTAALNTANSAYNLIRLGIDLAIQVRAADAQAAAEEKGHILGSGLMVVTLTATMASIFCALFAEELASAVFRRPELAHALRISASIVPFLAFSSYAYAALAGLHQFRSYAMATIATSVIGAALIMTGALTNDVRGALIATVAANVLAALWLGVVAMGTFHAQRIALSFRRAHLTTPALLRFGLPVYLSNVISTPVVYYFQGVASQVDGIESLAYLRVAWSFSMLILFVPTSIRGAVISSLANVLTNPTSGKDQFVQHSLANVKITWYFLLVTAFVATLIMPILVRVIYGAQYLPAVDITRVAIASAALQGVMVVASLNYAAERRLDRYFIQVLTFTVVLVAAGAWLIPAYGIAGYITAELFGYAAACIVTVFQLVHAARRADLEYRPILGLILWTCAFVMLCYTEMDRAIDYLLAIAMCVVSLTGYRVLLNKPEIAALKHAVLGWRRPLHQRRP